MDIRYALRQLRRNPGFTAVSVLTLALGIGVTTAIFSVVYGVLLRELPYPGADRIVAVNEVSNKGRPNALADPNFDDFRDQNRSFVAIAKYGGMLATISGASPPARAIVSRVSPQFLKVFGMQPIAGRDFAPDDARKGAAPVVMINAGYWTQFLGAARDLSAASIKIDGTSFAVIGVMPPGFRFPAEAEFWVATDREGEGTSRTSHNHRAVARLRDGVTVAQANGDISAIARRIHDESSEKGDYLLVDGMVTRLQDSLTGNARSPLLILLGAVGFLLLVACANVANLLLAQLSVRERELAMRTALGAGRGRLVRQFLAEAFLLAILGGGLGVLIAVGGVDALLAMAPSSLPRLEDVTVSLPVLAFALALSTAVAAGLGAFTAMRASSRDPREALVEGGRSAAGSSGAQRIGRTLVSAQMAITLVLVVGAGLLGRSLLKVLEVDPGFRIDRIIAMQISRPWVGFDPKANAAEGAFYASLIDRLRQIPGVREVGAASSLPLDGGNPDGMFAIVAPNEMPKTMQDVGELFKQKDRVGTADFCVATAGYFQALGIPLIRGRMFDSRDGADAPHAALITQSLARRRWPDEDPIGRTIEFGNMDGDLRLLTIVGIVGDTHGYGLDAPPEPTVYVDLFQRPRPAMTIAMLSDGDTQAVTGAARALLRELDPETPAKFQTFQQVYAKSLGSRRFNVVLIGFFGVSALLLAAIGVFGVMAHAVSRRTREIGVRVALGASTTDVLRMVFGQGLRPVAIGVVVGIAGALALTRTVSSMLFGVTPTDPLTFAGVTLLLVATSALACYIPARHAAKVDPMVALRQE